jgi:predicted transcriptional regulator
MGDNDIIMRMLWESERYTMDYPVGMLPGAEDASTQNIGTLLS